MWFTILAIVAVFHESFGQNSHNYHVLIEKADSAYSFWNWKTGISPNDSLKLKRALSLYGQAAGYDPRKQYPKDRILEIKKALHEARYKGVYSSLISDADSFRLNAEFEKSRQCLLKAHNLFPSENLRPSIAKMEFLSGIDDLDDVVIDSIHFGTKFGMCVGFCFNEIKFSKDKMIRRSVDLKSQVTEVVVLEHDATQYRDLVSTIDLTEFVKLNSTIGCPDCLDQGEEWITVFFHGMGFKVRYEYQKDIEPIRDTQLLLRAPLSGLSDSADDH